MPAKRSTPRIRFNHLDLSWCFGIQPIFVNPDDTVDCNLFNLDRHFLPAKRRHRRIVKDLNPKWCDVKFFYHKKTDEQKQQIVKNAIKYYHLAPYCIKMMRDVALKFEFDITIDEFINQGSKYVTNILLSAAIHNYIRNKLVSGNRFITSDPKIIDLLRMRTGIVGIYKKILVSEELLPRNEIIVTANGGMTFDNGILLCPLIYRKEFNRWMYENNKSEDFSYMKFANYPIMREYRYKMDLYEEFINEYIPMDWHFEVFENNAKFFYTVLRFKES